MRGRGRLLDRQPAALGSNSRKSSRRFGSRIVRLLVPSLGGTMTRAAGNPGCRVSLTIPER
jgi:two-component sensor histidine kinase